MDKEMLPEVRRGLMPVMTVEAAVSRYRQVNQFLEAVFREGVDYGTIPGTDSKTLLKPGAEKICALFGLTPTFTILERIEDWMGTEHGGEPFFYYLVRCELRQRDWLVVSADGSCNSWEPRYRWRWVRPDQIPPQYRGMELMKEERVVEEFDFAVREGITSGPYGKPSEYWEAIRRAIAEGRAERIQKPTRSGRIFDAWRVSTVMVRIPNPDVSELPNTLIKQAEKRALVAAALIAGNLSEIFTQDLEDYGDGEIVEVASATGVSTVAIENTPQRPPAEKEEPLPSKHWIENEAVRRRFWAWTNSIGLTNEEVHEALGVKSVKDFAGTPQEAKDTILRWVAAQQAAQQQPGAVEE